MFKDYYVILDISNSAILAEIKSAYRTQAKKWHPDKNHGIYGGKTRSHLYKKMTKFVRASLGKTKATLLELKN